MDIGAVYVQIMIIRLLQLCVDNLDILQQVSGYNYMHRIPHLFFSHIHSLYIYPYFLQARCSVFLSMKQLLYPQYWTV